MDKEELAAKFKVWSFSDFMAEREEDKLVHGKWFGPWYFDAEYMMLCYGDRDDAYHIRLEECGSSEGVLDWILQLSGKGWVSDSDLGQLVRALNEGIFEGLQGKVCSHGLSGQPGTTFDARAFIEGRLAK